MGVPPAGSRSTGEWAITPIDPHDDEQYAAWFAAIDASRQPVRPGDPGWQPPELRATMVMEEAPERSLPLVARDGSSDEVVGAAGIDIARFDNTHLAMLMLSVPPAYRRRGVGSALLEGLERLARAEGATTIACWRDEFPTDPGYGLARLFAERHGYQMVQRNLRRDLAVPIDAARRSALLADCTANSTGYHAEVFTGPYPERWLADRAEFGYRMSTDTPRGDFAREDEVWGVGRVRQAEALIEKQDRDHLCAVVVHEATGRLAGFTEIAVPRGAPSLAYQHDTLVLAEHRGHRLGMLLKLANLDLLARESPETRFVVTYNAADNDPMIAVNDALGCVVTADGLTWQKQLV
jgi:GNAT superfamily N-acetyltransferase